MTLRFSSPTLRFALILGGLIALGFFPVLAGYKSFYFRDFALFGHPLAHFHRESFWSGEIPFWNPLNNGGIPFLAQWNTMVLYPGALIYLLLPLPWSLNLFCLAHLFFAGMGAHQLLLRWTKSPVAASITGLAYAGNGLLLNSLMWPNNIAGLAWAPWILLASQSLLENPARLGGKSLLWFVLTGTAQMMTGAPEVILLTWVTCGTLALFQHFTIRSLPRLLLGMVFIALLSLPQLWPFLDLLRQSHRDAQYANAEIWPMPIWGWWSYLVPEVGTQAHPHGVRLQPAQLWTSSYYCGVVATVFALAAWRNWRDRRVQALWITTLLGMILALGVNGVLHYWLLQWLPIGGVMRYPVKFVILSSIGFPLLAGLGWAACEKEKDWRLPVVFAVILIPLTALVAAHAADAKTPAEDLQIVWMNAASRIAILLLAIGSVLPYARRWNWFPAAVAALVAVDLATHTHWQNPSIPSANLRENLLAAGPKGITTRDDSTLGSATNSALPPRAMLTPEAYTEMRSHVLTNAVSDYTIRRQTLANNINLLDGIAKMDGFFSLYLRHERELLLAFVDYPREDWEGLLDFQGVTHINNPSNPLDWLPRPSARPLLTGGQQPLWLEATNELPALFGKNFSPGKQIILRKTREGHDTLAAGPVELTRIQITNGKANAIATSKTGGWVTFAQTYSLHWQASVNGKPETIHQANHAYLALHVPPGEGKIEMEYREPHWRTSCLIAGAALLALLAATATQSPGIDTNPVAGTLRQGT